MVLMGLSIPTNKENTSFANHFLVTIFIKTILPFKTYIFFSNSYNHPYYINFLGKHLLYM